MKRIKGEGRGAGSFQSDACQALTKVLVLFFFLFLGWGVTWLGGWTISRKTELTSRDYFKEVCAAPIAFNSLPIPNIKLPKMCVCLTLRVHSITNWLPTAV